MTTLSHLAIDTSSAIRTITLNRPQRRNALGTAMMEELDQALRDADAAPDISAIVLTGAEPSFCAGSDLKELGLLDVEGMARHEEATAAIARSIAGLDLPVIAAVEGYALGGGCILALSCDLVVTARNAKWAMPEVQNGWLPPWGLEALTNRVELSRALAVVWDAQDIDGAEAHRIGMADLVTEPGQALAEAMAAAARLSARPRAALTSAKQFFASLRRNARQMDEVSSRYFQRDAQSDAAQAVLARFSGKS